MRRFESSSSSKMELTKSERLYPANDGSDEDAFEVVVVVFGVCAEAAAAHNADWRNAATAAANCEDVVDEELTALKTCSLIRSVKDASEVEDAIGDGGDGDDKSRCDW